MRVGIDGSRCFSDRTTGIERYADLLVPELARELDRRGHATTIYIRSPLKAEVADARVRRIGPRRGWTHLGLGPRSLLDRIDVLFVPSHVLPVFRPRRSVVVLHDACAELVPDAYGFWHRWYLRLTMADAVRTATVMTHSTDAAVSIEHIYGPPAVPLRVVSPPAPTITSAAAKLPWRTPFFLYIGRLERRKNVTTLLHAFDAWASAHPDLPHDLVLLGSRGYGWEDIDALLPTLRPRSRLYMAGYMNEEIKAAALRAASGILLPSLCEGSSLVLLEARAAGVPFAAADIGACREAGGDSGVYVHPPERVDAWMRALDDLVHHPRQPNPPPARGWNAAAREIADVLEQAERQKHR